MKSTGFLFFPCAKFFGMGEPHHRLIAARKAAKFNSARAAALRHHWNPSTYASHENGQTDLPKRAAALYAKAFKVSPGWLLTGETPQEGVKTRLQELVELVPPEWEASAIDYLEFLTKRTTRR